ncbi:MAG: hypothetical protein QG657_4142 [Acidobacteriota bacterium]|nr:hypothetical protein [Acidobacteriota bacterium]
MKIKTLIVILASILILNHCKKVVDSKPQIVQEEIKIDENKAGNVHFSRKAFIETDIIAYPMLAVSEWQDKVIVYGLSTADKKLNTWVARTYDKALNFISEKTFFTGQGPGDVGNFNIISITKDNILISENFNKRVTYYENDWTYLKSLKHGLPLDAFEIFDNGKVFMERKHFALENNKHSYEFLLGSIPDFNTKCLFRWVPFEMAVPSKRLPKLIIGCESEQAFFYKNKEAFLLECKKYHIMKFDSHGNKLKDIIVKVAEIKTDHSRDDYYLEELGFLANKNKFVLSDTVNPTVTMIPLTKGFVVIRRYDFITPCNDWVVGDYFSYQLEFFGKIKVPCSYNLLSYRFGRTNERFKYDNGFLYAIQETEEKTIIEKWEVTE